MGKKKTVRCAFCHRPIDSASQFCHYCGHRVRKLVKETLCPKCHKYIEHHVAYCTHCGFRMRQAGQRVTFVHVLKYFVSVLLVVLILVVFFTILYKQEERRALEQQVPAPTSFLNIVSLQCEKEQQVFRVCGTYAWEGLAGDYVTLHVPGELMQESTPFTQKSFNSCSDVGTEEGFRVVRMVLYNAQGVVLDQVSKGVLCKDTETPAPVPRQQVVDVVRRGHFRIERTTTYNRGFGNFTIDFEDVVVGCTYDGSYLVDDRFFERRQRRCNKARGTFSGRADARGQYVIDDPALFAWDFGLPEVETDPEPRRVDGYFFLMRPCEDSFYQEDYYQAEEAIDFFRARINGFGTSLLQVSWEFKDDIPDRAVEVLYTLHCKVQA